MIGSFVGTFRVCLAAFLILASGCDAASDLGEGEVDQAISGDFVDSSGAVTVRIKTCGWSASVSHPTATCSVDSDFVLIGGGAEVEGEGWPGALLTASYPSADLSTWIASSKDHWKGYAHRLRAYAVGLKLTGVSSVTLRNYMAFVSSQSGAAAHPSAVAELPPGFKLVGGGARANYSGQGIMLVASYPDSFQWVAEAKDHRRADSGTVDAYAIGITAGSIPGFGSIDTSSISASTWVSTGYGTADLSTPTGWVLASVGGAAQYDSWGRLLTDLIPFIDAPTNIKQGSKVRSKDHEVADSGFTTSYLISIRKQ